MAILQQTETPRAKRRIRQHVENLNHADDRVSMRAENYLGRCYGIRALGELVEACGHANPVVRFRAVWLLGHTHAPQAYEAILDLTDDPDERVRYDATLALGILGDIRAIEPLERIWLGNDDSRPGEAALAEIGLPALSAVERVFRCGTQEQRQTAVNILGDWAKMHKNVRCVSLLREAADDDDGNVREDARFWLGEAES
jgi:HEAT repeat protein